jgi:rod shape-determining protein MreB
MFSKDLGIDLGTMFTRLADSTQVLSEEPTIVAIEVADQKMVAVGQEARDMYGRVPESIMRSPRHCFPTCCSALVARCASSDHA